MLRTFLTGLDFLIPLLTSILVINSYYSALLNMQSIRISVLRHVRVSGSAESWLLAEKQNVLKQLSRQMCSSTVTCPDQIMDRVIGLVKKFDKIDASKVTETADFQKDLSLDSLDRVELVMAFEQEFSLDIPDEKADKLTCCADVAKYIVSGAEQKVVEES
ncbi:acyl carrier protein 3, mitochondrial isoform X1 [Quercus robur]|uniref:acyl carrier protein 3, mitochondrial isoform X1 n=2 Tax=Quercus robur TaxID=38942 RepID=UPI00216272C9|nr:acyl carrier protein 3, mitochondrial isoform X1 [Quercus robur]